MKNRLRSGTGLSALALLLSPAGLALDEGEMTAPKEDPISQVLDVRASTFKSSTKDSVALDVDASGRTVAVWQSRRQQGGTYGIYARRFDSDGSPLTAEVEINLNTRSHQGTPGVALDADGTAWLAWTSHGQDGDEGSVIARRFDAGLDSSTNEVLVNEVTAGNQTEVRIDSDGKGNAVVVWTSELEGSESRHVFARRLGPDGAVRGEALRVDADDLGTNGSPTVAMAEDGSFTVLWTRLGEDHMSRGVFGRRIAADGTVGAEFQLTPDRASGIEASLSSPDGKHFVAAWFEQHGGDWAIGHRRFTFDGEGAVELDGARRIESPEVGYLSGATVCARADGGYALAWNRYGVAPEQHADLFVATFDPQGAPLDAPRVATKATEGHQRIAADDGSKMLHYGDDGRLVVGWTGDAGMGDHHAAHVSWIAGEGQELAAASTDPEAQVVFDMARPHVPPTYTPGQGLQPLDPNPMFHPLTGGIGFTGITNTGWTPPDPELAVGPNHVVEMTNGAIAFFTKDGTATFQDQIEGSGGFWGPQGATGFVFDPEVIWDPHSSRFFAMANERASNGNPYFLLAVSDDSNPNGTWHKYRINVLSAIGDTDIDSPNMGIDAQAVYLTADFFGPDKYLVYVIEKAPLLSGGPVNSSSTVLNGRQSLGIPVSYGTPPRQYMIWSQESGTATSVTVYAINNPLTSPSLVSTTVSVPNFTQPENPPQANTSVRPETFESRFWSCMYNDGSLWATHHVNSSRVRQRWYEIDMANWPVSGTPTLVQSGEIDLGGTIRTFFGSIACDDAGNMGMTFSRSSPSEFISMGFVSRTASDAPGTTSAPVTAQTSNFPETNAGRWGDYSGIGPDPSLTGSFWAAHEFMPQNNSWRTWIQEFSVGSPIENYCITSANSVGPGALISATGTASSSANDLVLNATGCPLNVQGLFFYGPNETFTPLGNGWLCVAGNIQRLAVTPTNNLGTVSLAVDNTAFPVNGAWAPGTNWKLQYWYRDPTVGVGFNLTDALSVTFLP